MWLCDYTNDLGLTFKRVKPYIIGYNRLTNKVLPTSQTLLEVSNWVDIDGYYEVLPKSAVCTMMGRKRRLVLEKGTVVYEVDYYKPFLDLDWELFQQEGIAVETRPEFINDGDLSIMFLKL